jgi:hypothetical protein
MGDIPPFVRPTMDTDAAHCYLPPTPSRRSFLRAVAMGLGAMASPAARASQVERRLRVAAIYTVFRRRSHAFNILENFLEPYLFNGRRIDPGMDIVSFYADQTAADGDLTRAVAQRYAIGVHRTIAEALGAGAAGLNVDAVLLIGEHGEYATNALGQVEYPRKRFFDECALVMRRANHFVPMFNDKHLSYHWDWAREMYDTSRQLGIQLMAGSSVPLAERRPTLELPAGERVEEAVSIHGGGVESYDFHGLEVLQSLIEARAGGETGVASVEFLRGESLLAAAQQGRWSPALAEAAMAVEMGRTIPLREMPPVQNGQLHGILVTYRDGLRATVLKVGSSSTRWNFACKLANERELRATRFYVGPWGNRNLFQALSHAIQHHFRERRSPYPVERTLLTTGMVEAAMRSRYHRRRIDTPDLDIAYAARDFRAMREMGETWRLITPKMPEPAGLNPGIAR